MLSTGLTSAGERWASEARAAIASVDRELDEARAAERRWAATTGSASENRQPLELAVLAERRVALQRMRADLESQLGARQHMQGVTSALTIAQSHLGRVDVAACAPSGSGLATAASAQLLADQRGRLVTRLDVLRRDVWQWRAHVEMAMLSKPGTSPVDMTTPLVRRVDALIDERHSMYLL